jgi:hypothetical protein
MVTTAALLQPVLSSYPPLVSSAGLAFPRGRISEIFGPPSSGRTSLLLTILTQATAREGDICAIVDTDDSLDPCSAAAAGVLLNRLLWVRCGGHVPNAMKAADLLLQANGFGVVVIDLADTDTRAAQRIPLNYWYRFRRAVEQTRTALIVVTRDPNVRQCATLSVEARRLEIEWSGAQSSRLLEGVELRFEPRKPPGTTPGRLSARARS